MASCEPEALDLAACRADIDRAHTEVGDIAHDGAHRRWRMSIPAQPARDSDLLISAGLARGERLVDEVERLRAELAEAQQTIQRVRAELARLAQSDTIGVVRQHVIDRFGAALDGVQ